MLHDEESTEYQFENLSEESTFHSAEDAPEIDFEIQAQIAVQIFSVFVNTYGQEIEPYRGGLYSLAELACQYSSTLLFILHNQRIEERRRRDAYTYEED